MHDLVAIGEVLLRLSIPSPARFETVRQLDVQFGGAEANVAAACARLGLRTAWISALPANPWGERIRRELTGHGVDCAHVRMIDATRVGVYFLEYGVAPRPDPRAVRPARLGVRAAHARGRRLGAGAAGAAGARHRDHAGARGRGPRARRARAARGVDSLVRRQLSGDALAARRGARLRRVGRCRRPATSSWARPRRARCSA